MSGRAKPIRGRAVPDELHPVGGQEDEVVTLPGGSLSINRLRPPERKARQRERGGEGSGRWLSRHDGVRCSARHHVPIDLLRACRSKNALIRLQRIHNF
jgi:hypothetical protein